MNDGTDDSNTNLIDPKTMTIGDIPLHLHAEIEIQALKKAKVCVICGSNRCRKMDNHHGRCCEHAQWKRRNYNYDSWCGGCRTLQSFGYNNVMFEVCSVCGRLVLYERTEGLFDPIALSPRISFHLAVYDGSFDDKDKTFKNMRYVRTICSDKCLRHLGFWLHKKGLEGLKEKDMVYKMFRHTNVKLTAKDLHFDEEKFSKDYYCQECLKMRPANAPVHLQTATEGDGITIYNYCPDCGWNDRNKATTIPLKDEDMKEDDLAEDEHPDRQPGLPGESQ